MLVEFVETVIKWTETGGGETGEFVPYGPVAVNPRHVVTIRPVFNEDRDKQSFVSQLRMVDGDFLCVEGSPSEVRAKLNGGAR